MEQQIQGTETVLPALLVACHTSTLIKGFCEDEVPEEEN